MSADDTYLARLTPPATAAIAVLAMRGPKVWQVLEKTFRPNSNRNRFFEQLPSTAEPGQFWLGKMGESEKAGDDIVLSLKRQTPEPWVEIHCHGGLQVLAMLEELLSSHGVTVCPWPEFLRRSGAKPFAVSALKALSKSTTRRTAGILLHQYHGAFLREMLAVKASLSAKNYEQANRQIQELAQRIPLGRHLNAPWQVAVAGVPNVGKSSLINLLAGYQRSIVDATPGTTRDLVRVPVAIDGWPVELTDTAGVRNEAGDLEQQGIDLAKQIAQQADLCLWLLDGSATPVLPDFELPSVVYLINKTDLPAGWDWQTQPDALRISVTDKTGVDALCDTISKRLVAEPPTAEAGVPFTEEDCQLTEQLWDRVIGGNYEEASKMLDRWIKLSEPDL